MKNKKAERLAALGAFIVALMLVIYFAAVAIRRRSIVSALLAVAAAMSGLGLTFKLFSELVAPDSDGVRTGGCSVEDKSELFEGAEADVAVRRMDADLGII